MRKYLAAKSWKTPAKVRERRRRQPMVRRAATPRATRSSSSSRLSHPRPSTRPRPSATTSSMLDTWSTTALSRTRSTAICSASGPTGVADADPAGRVGKSAVPDGHDWLEYMLAAGPGSGIPANMTQRVRRARPSLHRRSLRARRLQGARSRQSARPDATIKRPRSASTANTSSTCTIPTASAWN